MFEQFKPHQLNTFADRSAKVIVSLIIGTINAVILYLICFKKIDDNILHILLIILFPLVGALRHLISYVFDEDKKN